MRIYRVHQYRPTCL